MVVIWWGQRGVKIRINTTICCGKLARDMASYIDALFCLIMFGFLSSAGNRGGYDMWLVLHKLVVARCTDTFRASVGERARGGEMEEDTDGGRARAICVRGRESQRDRPN